MSTTISSFSSTEMNTRWEEPYTSAALNRSAGARIAPGIHRGFRLDVNAGALKVTAKADAKYADHAATYRQQDGYAVSIKKSGGDFDIDLSAVINTTVLVCIYVSYAISSATVAELRAYTLAQYNAAPEKDQLVVILS